MKQLLMVLMLVGLLLTGCSGQESIVKYRNFLSDEEGRYSLYSVVREENSFSHEELQELDLSRTVSSFVNEYSTETTRIPVNEIPTFMVFDTKEKVYQTNDREDVISFLRENK